MKRLSCVAPSAVAIFSFMFAGCAVTGQDESLSSPTSKPDSAGALTTRPQASEPSSVVLFQQDFEGAKGHWAGRIITEGVPAGSTRALAAVANETHWARRASVHNRGVIRAAENTVLTFRYRISKDLPLTLYVINSDGTGLTQITESGKAGTQAGAVAKWSPDGKQIAYLSDFPDSEGNPPGLGLSPGLFLVSNQGGEATRLQGDEVALSYCLSWYR